jgi:uncharacterized protein DUF3800
MTYLFERAEYHCRDNNSDAFCVYDHDKTRTDTLHDQTMTLIRDGSAIKYSDPSNERIEIRLDLDHLIEVTLCSSEYSLGLQIADFFATFAYQYFKKGKPKSCGWWKQICSSLYRHEGKLDGYGLKVFP